MASLDGLLRTTSLGQRAAVTATMRLLDDAPRPRFVPTPGEDEIWFVLPETGRGTGLRDAEQVLTQVLGRKVWITRDDDRYVESPAFPSSDEDESAPALRTAARWPVRRRD